VKRFAFLLMIFLSKPGPASAQEARSFEQLQVLVKPGDSVYVTETGGTESKGRITGLSTTSLQIQANGRTRDLMETDVARIRQWRQDSLRNGALIGAGAGLALSTAFVATLCDDDCRNGWAVLGVVFYTGVGAAAGAGIDALIPHKRTIYAGGKQTALQRLGVRPILNRSRKGIEVTFKF
jgi:hypothetical protein